MSIRQYDATNRAVKYGGYTVLNLSINGRTAIPIGMESAPVGEIGTPIEFPDGTGTVQGIVITNQRSSLSGSFYIYGDTLDESIGRYSTTKTTLIYPGEVLLFTHVTGTPASEEFNELVDRTWYAINSGQTRSWGDRWRVTFSAVAYNNVRTT